MSYDVIVLGTGPAGLAAAVAAKGRGLNVLLIGNRWQESPLARAERIDNYLGLPGRDGKQMLEEFYRHAEELGVEFVVGRATNAMAWENYSLTVGNDVYQSTALILALGVVRQSKYPGEEQYLGKGVSYCATCDGMLYRGKSVAVVGRSSHAAQEANFLQGLGCQTTYVAGERPEDLSREIPFIKGGKLEILGEQRVTALTVNGTRLPCDGVFILREAVASTDLLPALKTEGGSIVVDRDMRTNLPGVFAAGDCTGAPLQISKAVGEGHVAGLAAADYCALQ